MCKKKMIKEKKKSNKNKTKQRTVAIDSCRRTSNPDFNFMERRKGIKCGRWVCYKTHFRGAYLFFFYFAKATCRLQSISFIGVQGNRNVFWFRFLFLRTNFIFHQIWTWKSCKMKIYATFRTLGLISVVIFQFLISLLVSMDYLCMCYMVILCFL